MNYPNKDEPTERKSAFHGGFQYLERIDKLLQELNNATTPKDVQVFNEYMINGVYFFQYQYKWDKLKRLHSELNSKLNKTKTTPDDLSEREYHIEELNKCENAFNLASKQINEDGELNTEGLKFIKLFEDWERELRDIVDIKGLLMPDKKGGLDATDQ